MVVAAANSEGANGGRMVVVSPLELRMMGPYPGLELTFAEVDGLLGSAPPKILGQALGNRERLASREEGVEVRFLADGKGRPSIVARARWIRPQRLVLTVLQHQIVHQVLAGLFIALLAGMFPRSVVDPEAAPGRRRAVEHVIDREGEVPLGNAEEFHRLDRPTGMVDRVAVQRHEMVKNARRAGMSDVSMGVVHAAGNILKHQRLHEAPARTSWRSTGSICTPWPESSMTTPIICPSTSRGTRTEGS